jgi:hypothetical protein
MFFLIGGIQPRTRILESVQRSCPRCGHFELQQKRVDSYLSLFFIPLFPIKKGVSFWQCNNCSAVITEIGLSQEYVPGTTKENCPHCGRSVAADFIYCPYCSFPLPRS